jgi:hypothetical protein
MQFSTVSTETPLALARQTIPDVSSPPGWATATV